MPANAVFLDTNGWLALLNASEELHQRADAFWRSLGNRNYSVVLTDWIIAETGNGLARTLARERFALIAQSLFTNPRCRVVFVTPSLVRQGLDLFRQRADKQWGLVDCVSFSVMTNEGINEAFTTDRHFEQAGFKALLI
jgi:predicted nucleic acid-binding protein